MEKTPTNVMHYIAQIAGMCPDVNHNLFQSIGTMIYMTESYIISYHINMLLCDK